MCGLHFIVKSDSSVDRRVENFLKNAFLANQVRGVDGAGMFVIPHGENPEPDFYKTQAPGSAFITDTRGQKLLDAASKGWLGVGHVRAATQGDVNTQNAHPFRIVRTDGSCIIGVHNGTLKRWDNHERAVRHKVDSEWALSMIASHGEEAFEYFDGAYAFIWWDSKTPDKFYVARNADRSLFFLYSSDKKTIYGASEAGMLGWLAERNNVTRPRANDKYENMFYFAPNKLYTFNRADLTKYEVTDLPKFDWKKLPYQQSSTASGTRSTAMTHYRGYSGQRSQDYYDGLADDWYGGRSGYWAGQQQTNILEGVKRAIKGAQALRRKESGEEVLEGEVITEHELQVIMDASIQRVNSQPSSAAHLLAYKPYFLHSPVDSTATKGEIKSARNRQIYGRVVGFKPEYYDPQGQALVGEFFLKQADGDGMVLPMVGELRYDITEAKARNLIDSDSVILATVVGVADLDKNTETYVVAGLGEDERKNVNSTLRAYIN